MELIHFKNSGLCLTSAEEPNEHGRNDCTSCYLHRGL